LYWICLQKRLKVFYFSEFGRRRMCIITYSRNRNLTESNIFSFGHCQNEPNLQIWLISAPKPIPKPNFGRALVESWNYIKIWRFLVEKWIIQVRRSWETYLLLAFCVIDYVGHIIDNIGHRWPIWFSRKGELLKMNDMWWVGALTSQFPNSLSPNSLTVGPTNCLTLQIPCFANSCFSNSQFVNRPTRLANSQFTKILF